MLHLKNAQVCALLLLFQLYCNFYSRRGRIEQFVSCNKQSRRGTKGVRGGITNVEAKATKDSDCSQQYQDSRAIVVGFSLEFFFFFLFLNFLPRIWLVVQTSLFLKQYSISAIILAISSQKHCNTNEWIRPKVTIGIEAHWILALLNRLPFPSATTTVQSSWRCCI